VDILLQLAMVATLLAQGHQDSEVMVTLSQVRHSCQLPMLHWKPINILTSQKQSCIKKKKKKKHIHDTSAFKKSHTSYEPLVPNVMKSKATIKKSLLNSQNYCSLAGINTMCCTTGQGGHHDAENIQLSIR